MSHEVIVRPGRQEAAALVMEVKRLVSRHPRVASAVVSALIAEGRRALRTEEGRAWLAGLRSSERVARARVAWDAIGLGAVPVREDAAPISRFVAAFAAAAAQEGPESLAAAVRESSR
ncbi:MAG TPA: hypothetical protein VFA20_17015 [Myxococcaceae bacterium]|nr:hypothetical protein [Myxococcaceae bacterium]